MNELKQLEEYIEVLDANGIRTFFENGLSPNSLLRNRPLVYELIGGYARGPKFRECVSVFVDHGLEFPDDSLLAVLLDDASSLERQLKSGQAADATYTLDCAFTPLYNVSLLHVCAEFNHVRCAEVLLNHGADVNARAGTDEHGFGGHTPVFHTVNQHANGSMDVLKLLLSRSADLSLTVKGLIWGRGYAWETFIPAVNPVSYAMMGLLRQFQRNEKQIYEVVSMLMKAAYGIDYVPGNVPNKYLAGSGT